MKKFGFTLAEVLITLTIIGVVAAVTLPALQANVQKRAAIAKFKKAVNILNNVGQTVEAVNGFNFHLITCPLNHYIHYVQPSPRISDFRTNALKSKFYPLPPERGYVRCVGTTHL